MSSGAQVIIQAFLRWVETAKTSDRARAASALARAYAKADMNGIDRHAAEMAMTYLLDGRQFVLIPSGTTLLAFALP